MNQKNKNGMLQLTKRLFYAIKENDKDATYSNLDEIADLVILEFGER